MDDTVAFMTAIELVARYRAGDLSPVEATETALARLERFEPVLNAFQLVDAEGARAAAKASEDRWAQGAPAGPLDGVPLTIKDIVLTRGWPTLNGSLTVDPDQAWDVDCPSVARLRESGAVLLGKTTTPEFGWKGITDSPLGGVTRNPWNPAHSPGGSSGGAAAALAAGIGNLAHGTDGGGSIRIPASYSGLFGIKPSFGRVPHAPRESPYSTLSSNGPLARSVRDAALMLNVLALPDTRDWYAIEYVAHDWLDGLDDGIQGLRIGYAPELGGAQPEPEVRSLVDAAAARFAELGAEVEDVGPVFEPLRPTFEQYWVAGFGHILKGIPADKHDLLDPGFRALAERGLAVGLDDYEAAVSARVAQGDAMSAFHARHDLLLTPTLPTPPPPAETIYHSAGFDRWDHATPYTVPFNLTGQPAASMPCGLTDDGLPVGLQVIGPRFAEATVLRACRAYEAAHGLVQPHPKLLASLAEFGA